MRSLERPTLMQAWPAFAAGVGAWAGMWSCLRAALPLSMYVAPVLGMVVTGAVFVLLLRLAPPPPTADLQRARLRIASLVACLACVFTGWRFASLVNATAARIGRGEAGPVPVDKQLESARLVMQLGLSGGVVMGLGAATLVAILGRVYYARVSSRPSPLTPQEPLSP